MKENEEKMHFPKMSTVDKIFFSTQAQRDEEKQERVEMLDMSQISDFPNHPYQVNDDEEMYNMADSIKENGLIHPVIVRPKQNGGYEMISGHRRKRANELAGNTKIKAIIRELTDDEAIILMVDSNKQREKVLPSEKAFAYKMKLEAMKHQGKQLPESLRPLGEKLYSIDILGEEVGESGRNIQRYIRLTELIPDILQLVDEEKIKLRPAVEISYLKKDEQEILLDAIETSIAYPSHAQAIRIRKKSEDNTLTADDIYDILDEEKPNQKEQIKFKVDNVRDYFPKGYTTEKMQNVMQKLLEEYRNRWQRKEKEYSR